MHRLSILCLVIAVAFASCIHNADAPAEQVIHQDIPQDSSVIFLPISSATKDLAALIKAKIPDPLLNENKNIKAPVFNALTTPELITTTKLVDGTCDVAQRVRISWKCVFCPSCCFTTVMVKQACKVARPVTEWVNKTVIQKTTVDVPVAYLARINDIGIDGDGNTIHVHATVDFRLKGEVPIIHLGAASCGYGEPMPQIALELTATATMTNDGQLSLAGKQWNLKWNSPCNLTAMDINVEDLMDLPIVKQLIEKKLDDLVQNKIPNSINLKDQLAKKWDDIASPRNVAGYGFFYPGIIQLNSRDIFISKDSIDWEVGAICKPLLDISSDTPAIKKAPLPALVIGKGNDSFRITVMGTIGLDELSSFANDQLHKNKEKITTSFFQLDNVSIYQHGEEVVTGVELSKPFRGKVYLTCQPNFDLVNNTLTFGRLTFTTDSRNVLAKYGARLLDEPLIQNAVSALAKYKYKKDLNKAAAKLKDFSQPIGKNFLLKINLATVSPGAVVISDRKLVVTAHATGQAKFIVR